MAERINIDASEMGSFARELATKAKESRWMETATHSSCDRIVAAAKRNVEKSAPIHNAGAHKYIDSEVEWRGKEIIGIVGYNTLHRPARLGNLLEFGNGGDPSPPHWDLARALHGEEDRFYDKLGDSAEGLLESRWGELREV